MKWISVKDQLPDQDTEYLVYITVDNRQIMTTAYYYKSANYWEIHDCVADNGYDIPTHWMKLPEPPKE